MQQPDTSADIRWSRAWWAQLDAWRQQEGELMDRMGFGPETTPSRRAHEARMLRLHAYQTPDPQRPIVLIVPAPIKASYIWDLAPDVSAVRRCLDAGLQVYLIAWGRPGPGDESFGLAEYADRFIHDCLDVIAAETGQKQFLLAGHSLGGTLAAIYASLHSDRVLGLLALEGPIEFHPDSGPLETAVAHLPAANTITELLGNVPGSFLNVASQWADPVTFSNEPLMDWFESLISPRASRLYLLVRRWTLDETPLPRRLFEEVVDMLYRENQFAAGRLRVDGRAADIQALRAPVLAVRDVRSRVIPAVSVDAYNDRTGSDDVQLFDYAGDIGVMLQHVGVLVGEGAHRELWPRIQVWMQQRAYVVQ